MKTALILGVAITLLGISTTLGADDTTAKDAKKSKAAPAAKAKKAPPASADQKGGTMLTGSYIKQNLNHYGRITDGFSQVIVLDRQTIERSGASDLRQLLTRQGVH